MCIIITMIFFPQKTKSWIIWNKCEQEIVWDLQIVDNSRKKPTYNRFSNARFISLSWIEDIIFYNGDFYGLFGLKMSRVELVEN